MNDRTPGQEPTTASLLQLIRAHDGDLREAIPGYQYAAVYPVFDRLGLHPTGSHGVIVHLCGPYDSTEIAGNVRRILGQEVNVMVRRERHPVTL